MKFNIREQEWYKYIFARFERKDFLRVYMFSIVFIVVHILLKGINMSRVTPEVSAQFQYNMSAFVAVSIVCIGCTYLYRVYDLIFDYLKRKFHSWRN